MREIKKILQNDMAHLVRITSNKLKRAANKGSTTEFIGDYKLLEVIVKRITVREKYDASFTFIDESKAKVHIAGTGKTQLRPRLYLT